MKKINQIVQIQIINSYYCNRRQRKGNRRIERKETAEDKEKLWRNKKHRKKKKTKKKNMKKITQKESYEKRQ